MSNASNALASVTNPSVRRTVPSNRLLLALASPSTAAIARQCNLLGKGVGLRLSLDSCV